MKLILHIGMGKTGTSSIQAALHTNKKELQQQKVHYLGIWFDVISPSFLGYEGNEEFFKYTLKAPSEAAQTLFSKLNEIHRRTNLETFILSNESIFGNIEKNKEFISEVSKLLNLKIVAYIRDPRDWIPCAYTQWRLNHKVHSGPIRPISNEAKNLVATYDSFPIWYSIFSEILKVRLHDSKMDVVKDFAEVCEITLGNTSIRHLARNEDAEILLRAAFNNRIESPVLPNRFNEEIVNTSKQIPSLNELAKICFGFDGVIQAVDSRKEIFAKMRDDLGSEFDFFDKKFEERKPHDYDAIQSRLIDYLVEISFTQSDRIRKLEDQVKLLQTEIQKE